MSTIFQEKYKKKVLDELEENGTINLIKSNLKSQIVEIIKKEKKDTKRKLDFEMLTPFQKVPKSKELMLLSHLIIEFMEFYEMEYSIPIFKGETNIKEKIKKETLIKDAALRTEHDENQPILLQVLQNHLLEKPKPKPYEEPFNKKDKEYYYSGLNLLSSINSQKKEKDLQVKEEENIVKPAKKLAPLSFNNVSSNSEPKSNFLN